MSNAAIVYPVFAHVVLVFVLMLVMFNRRVAAIKARELTLRDAMLPARAFPERATLAANAYQNQFEMPLLFYAAVLFAIVLNGVNTALVVLAWAYVAARAVHALLHVNGANALQRMRPFAVSALILLAMWVLLALHLIQR
jgi:hypothetical protein